MDNLSYRTIEETSVSLREDAGVQYISGRAIVYNKPTSVYEFGKRHTEIIRPGAMSPVIKSGRNIKLVTDHNEKNVLGMTRAGTVSLREEADGVYFDCPIAATTLFNDTVIRINRKEYAGCSFNFSQPLSKGTWNKDKTYREITELAGVTHITLGYDPAYEGTSVSLREFDEGEYFRFRLLLAENL